MFFLFCATKMIQTKKKKFLIVFYPKMNNQNKQTVFGWPRVRSIDVFLAFLEMKFYFSFKKFLLGMKFTFFENGCFLYFLL